MKSKIFLIPLLCLSMLCSGCGDNAVITSQTQQTEISLSWWGNDTRNEYTIEAVKRFEKLHPEIKVICKYSEWSGYQARSNVQMVSNTEADVMQINYAWIQQYSPDGYGYYDISTLSDYIDLSNFSEEELSFGMQNGRLNAVPIALNTQSLYINKTVYEQYGLDIPKTWEDIFNASRVMKGEVYPLAMTAKSAWFYITAYAEQRVGKQFMTMDGRLNFSAQDIQIMLEFYCRLINEKVMPQVEYFDRLLIDTGEYAGSVAWLSDASNYCNNAVQNGYEFVVADYPVNETARTGDGWYAKPATMYAISKNTDYPEESALLLDFLLNSPEMAELQGVEKGIPISRKARSYLEENNMLTGMQYNAFLKMNEYSDRLAVVSPYFENTDLIDAFKEACNAVLYNKSDSKEKSVELYNTFNDILS
ncbi:MAG: ABC transporter substrate-binding protein [Ruminococcus sp.]|nr:ABC transporter substrate-binding protein [Oscillospiraceae bacterium]MDY4414438.1 ABC transporter substrate-binding protein [Ruminococcus sp.]